MPRKPRGWPQQVVRSACVGQTDSQDWRAWPAPRASRNRARAERPSTRAPGAGSYSLGSIKNDLVGASGAEPRHREGASYPCQLIES